MPSVAQLNVRMSAELKAAGDSVLDLYGIAPSELIRAMWSKVAHGEQALDQVVRVLAADPSAASVKTIGATGSESRIAQRVRQRQADFEREVGLDPSSYAPLTDEQLDDLLYQDYLEESVSEEADHED